MRQIATDVLVIGGGATGAGVLRDLAMRGLRVVLVERGDLTHGTTGRYHGLLHSGARYAVKDPQSASECAHENEILRRIMPHCIEDTGGLFVVTPADDEVYAAQFVQACRATGVAVDELPVREVLHREPLLNPRISRAFAVRDAAADSFLATHANVEDARRRGAQVLTYHQITQLLGESSICGAICEDLRSGEQVRIHAEYVINAAGAWAGKIAALAGATVTIVPGKGTMVATNHRLVNTVINRCKLPADGDIIVPIRTVAVLGTTDISVPDPDAFAITPEEIALILHEGDQLVPGVSRTRILRAWAGVRPLYKDRDVTSDRDIPRTYKLLDHEIRDGVRGLISIVGGKWTTYRKMAEEASDTVMTKLGITAPCRTHQEPLPGAERGRLFWMGQPLAEVEAGARFGELICECELVTRDQVTKSITGGAVNIDDVRRDTRLGMGPCQGGFCAYRAVALWQELRGADNIDWSALLRQFLTERWKGIAPVCWGDQLRQARLDELIYLDTLNIGKNALPATQLSPSLSPPLSVSKGNRRSLHRDALPEELIPERVVGQNKSDWDALVIGAGLAGLMGALVLAEAGCRTLVVAKGHGAMHWGTATVDIWGSAEDSLEDALGRLIEEHPEHPYARVGIAGVTQALDRFQALMQSARYPYAGGLKRNILLPTALGALRPTALMPITMAAGDMRLGGKLLLAGFRELRDFFPLLAAANLAARGIPARGIYLQLPPSARGRDFSTRTFAQLFDDPQFREQIGMQLRRARGEVTRIGLPAVLGLHDPVGVLADLQQLSGAQIFEIPTLPPSIPGMRLFAIFRAAIEQAGGRIQIGSEVIGGHAVDRRLVKVYTEAAARQTGHCADRFLLATGGLLGGGIFTDHTGAVWETALDLPVQSPRSRAEWFAEQSTDPRGHPIYRAGIPADSLLRPIGQDRRVIYDNLAAAGSTLAGVDGIRERCTSGLAIATAWRAGHLLAGDLE